MSDEAKLKTTNEGGKMSMQNDIERLQDKIQIGALDVSSANVELVKIQRFKIIKNGLPRRVRKDLNEAVKKGELGHYKKDDNKPERIHE